MKLVAKYWNWFCLRRHYQFLSYAIYFVVLVWKNILKNLYKIKKKLKHIKFFGHEILNILSVKSVRNYYWSVFFCSRIRNNSVFGHFSCSDCFEIFIKLYLKFSENFYFLYIDVATKRPIKWKVKRMSQWMQCL